jgi:alkylation response protein AidB-like acyl-CoA dehydrogenase
MDFDLTDEQRLLSDSVGRLMADTYGFEKRRALIREPEGFSPVLWAKYAELGLLGLPFAEEYGGFGGGAVEVMLVMEAFGRALALEPYLATVVLAGTALRLAASGKQQEALLPVVADGSLKLAFAHGERQARYDLTDVTTTATRSGGDYVLEGGKSVVLHGDGAGMLVVSARTGGARGEAGGISLFLVDAGANGVARRGYALRDGSRAAEISLSGVKVPAGNLLVEAGIAAMCAEAVGAMEAMQAMTLDYLKTRQQFGKPIGENQVLQHRSAEMLVALESARGMAMLAAMMVDEPDAAERERNIAMAKVGVGQSGRFVSQQAIQLHGGIGMTEEYAIGHFFRRIMVIEHLFGDTAHHLDRLVDLAA